MKYKVKSTFRKLPSTVVPDRAAVKTKYAGAYHVTDLAANTYDESVYNANNAADPGGAADTKKVLGYATWQAFYKYYRVYASKIDVKIAGDIDTARPLGVVVMPVLDNTGFTLWTSAMAQPYAKVYDFSSGYQTVHAKHFMTTEKIYGLNKKTVETDADFWSNSDIVTGPAFKWYWLVGVYNQSETALVDVELLVTITYYVEFFGRRQMEIA